MQATKAKFCGDSNTLKHIMETSSALECKNLGKDIKNSSNAKWNKSAKDLCYPGILAKFQQNQGLAPFLKNTGEKTILEFCYDEIWGNGLPLSNPLCIDPKSYKKQGVLGEILEDVRTALLAECTLSGHPSVEDLMDERPSLPVQTYLHVETLISCGNKEQLRFHVETQLCPLIRIIITLHSLRACPTSISQL